MKYIVEKGNTMPLCAVKDDLYFNYLDGQVIDNENTLNFIKEGLKRKSLKKIKINLLIYKIISKEGIIAYNYQINSCSNFLSDDKKLVDYQFRELIIDKLMSGEFTQELIWGDD